MLQGCNEKLKTVLPGQESMSTSQAREINNSMVLTILRLGNVSRKECGTIVFSMGTGP